MIKIQKIKLFIFLALCIAFFSCSKVSKLGFGTKVKINDNLYYQYSFDKKPALGTSILKIILFDNSHVQKTDYAISGNYGMPSMKGKHDSGAILFQQNKKGYYLLPVSVVMPGTWEILIDISKNTVSVYKGTITFEVK